MLSRLKILIGIGLGLLAGCERGSGDSQSTVKRSLKKGDYLVVSMVDQDSPFQSAARQLAERHDAEILQAAPQESERLLLELKQRKPTLVAFVIHPHELDINLVQEILVVSTQVDSDPFVDFAYGFITGRDGEAARQLVAASDSGTANKKATITMFGVGSKQMGQSAVQKFAWPLRNSSVSVTNFQSVGDSDETRDEKFIKKSMPKLSHAPILLLASHGYPDGLVGGPKAIDVKGVDLSGSVALNIACYNGVTKSWYEDDWSTMQIKKREIAAEGSFCLQMIDSGVAGYVAYACPRPAGPTLMGDAMILASSGLSLGELRRADANSVVLAHLLSGDTSVETKMLSDGMALKRDRTAGQAVKQMSTGAMLIGDPAYIPFQEKLNSDPRTTAVTEKEDRLLVTVKIETPMFHFYAGEQINYWNGRDPALRLETVVPLGDRFVTDVQVAEPPAGVTDYRFVAAVEQDRGQRFLHLKLTFPQPKDLKMLQAMATTGLTGQFEILTSGETTDPANDSTTIFRSQNGE